MPYHHRNQLNSNVTELNCNCEKTKFYLLKVIKVILYSFTGIYTPVKILLIPMNHCYADNMSVMDTFT